MDTETILAMLGITNVSSTFVLPSTYYYSDNYGDMLPFLLRMFGVEEDIVCGDVHYFPEVAIAVASRPPDDAIEDLLCVLSKLMMRYELPIVPKKVRVVMNDGIRMEGEIDVSFLARMLRKIIRIKQQELVDVLRSAVQLGDVVRGGASDVRIKRLSVDLSVTVRYLWVSGRVIELRAPVTLTGHVDAVVGEEPVLDGDFKCIPAYLGDSFCFGSLPPFDGTLDWLRSLVGWLTMPNFDNRGVGATCFVRRFRRHLPPLFFELWGGMRG